jgi:hypothetical protein
VQVDDPQHLLDVARPSVADQALPFRWSAENPCCAWTFYDQSTAPSVAAAREELERQVDGTHRERINKIIEEIGERYCWR